MNRRKEKKLFQSNSLNGLRKPLSSLGKKEAQEVFRRTFTGHPGYLSTGKLEKLHQKFLNQSWGLMLKAWEVYQDLHLCDPGFERFFDQSMTGDLSWTRYFKGMGQMKIEKRDRKIRMLRRKKEKKVRREKAKKRR